MKLKKISKKTYLIMLSVILVLVTMIGTSFGFFMKVDEKDVNYQTGILSIELVTSGDDLGQTINLYNTVPMTDEEGKALSPYKFKVTNTGTLNYKFDLKLVLDQTVMNEDGCTNNTLDYSNVKIMVNDNEPVLLSSLTDSIILANTTLAPKKSITLEVRMWLDENTTNQAIGKHFHAKLATDGYAVYTEEEKEANLATLITNKYNDNKDATPVVNNSINYYYASSESLMQDVGNNIRYYGANPNNYIYFNCDDYSNQTADTCEVWRIIGVFDGKVKIIRNTSIGTYSWDTSASTENSGRGYNQWGENGNYKGADLMKLLNPGYSDNTGLISMPGGGSGSGSGGSTGGSTGGSSSGSSTQPILVNNSLYYNAGSGTCYSGARNEPASCDFTKTGLKNDQTRNLISETLYYLGGHDSSSVYSDQMYEYERGTTTGTSPYAYPTWKGYVAVLYASDYGYAADFNTCDVNLSNEGGSVNTRCIGVNWINTLTSSRTAFLTPVSYGSISVFGTGSYDENGLQIYDVSTRYNIFPVLHLDTKIDIDKATTGTSDNPYKLIVK